VALYSTLPGSLRAVSHYVQRCFLVPLKKLGRVTICWLRLLTGEIQSSDHIAAGIHNVANSDGMQAASMKHIRTSTYSRRTPVSGCRTYTHLFLAFLFCICPAIQPTQRHSGALNNSFAPAIVLETLLNTQYYL
jgi:hypothetical protein